MWQTQLQQHGYAYLKNAGRTGLRRVIGHLGEVIQVTEVRNEPDTPALVTSDRALDYHTDHPKVDYIAWLCHRQAASGGETLLADARAAFARLSADEQSALARIRLFEHKVFADDADDCPLVTRGADGAHRFYYSFWLVKQDLPPAQQRALARFRAALPAAQIAPGLRLARGDILVVDNTRALHGRRAFAGGRRHLTRHWIRRHDGL